MSKLYRVEITLAATVYVRADDESDALARVSELRDDTLEVNDANESQVPISGLSYDDPSLPDLSISPAMTILALDDHATAEEVE